MTWSPASKARLTGYDLPRFSGDTLFDRVGRALCTAGCLPRKELFEAWEMARRVRRLVRGGLVVDVAGGHGLLAHLLLILDDTSPSAVVVDPAVPPSAARVHAALVEAWPRLAGRVDYRAAGFSAAGVPSGALVVSCHGCGALTDRVLEGAIAAGADVAVLPCCHDVETCDVGVLGGWMAPALAIDAVRALRLAGQGYRVWTLAIPESVTPKNRLLVGVRQGRREG